MAVIEVPMISGFRANVESLERVCTHTELFSSIIVVDRDDRTGR